MCWSWFALAVLAAPLMRVAGATAGAGLTLSLWQNTALGPPGAEASSVVPAVDFVGAFSRDASSARILGELALPAGVASQSFNFSLLTDGVARLWLDDHLVLDTGAGFAPAAPQLVAPHLAFPVAAAPASYPFRLDVVGAATVQLRWAGNFTPVAVVPAAAFSTAVDEGQQQRWALRRRLEAPRVPWQTWLFSDMAAHVHVPDGFYVPLALGDAATGETFTVNVPYQFTPAWVRPGPHSFNGSDYTQLNVTLWGGRDCSILLETTTANDSGSDLMLLATPAPGGRDCASIAIVVQPGFAWGRGGSVVAASGSNVSIVGSPVGSALATTTLWSLSGPGMAAWPGGRLSQPFFALPLAGGAVALSTGAMPSSLAVVQAAVAAAAARQAAAYAPYGALADAFQGAHDVHAWNTIFTPYEGVITPITRSWDFGGGYVLFNWDTYLSGVMLSGLATNAAEGGGAAGTPSGVALDLAMQNAAQMTLGRTLMGLVPNEVSGLRDSVEITEPYVGAQALREMLALHGESRVGWLVRFLWPHLFRWLDWAWEWRVLRGGAYAGPLLTWGANAFQPARGDLTPDLQVARYESGLDNSPLYDSPPVEFNASTGLMNAYDVGASGLFCGDAAALIGLAAAANASADDVAVLRARSAAVSAALNAHLWDASAGVYTNRMAADGAAVPHLAPANFFPLLDGATASAAQAAAMARNLADPALFCLNASHANASALAQLHDFWLSAAGGRNDNCACASDRCLRDQVVTRYAHVRVEALVIAADAGEGVAGLVPLYNYYSAARQDNALSTNSSAGPDGTGGYTLVSLEGWCLPDGALAGTVPLTLWFSPARGDYQACGTAACLADAGSFGYEPANGGRPLCYVFNTSTLTYRTQDVTQLPCGGFPSVARNDAAFWDNDYWRGRTWGPHQLLAYWGLRAADGADGVADARRSLVQQGLRAFRVNYGLFGHIYENFNSVLLVGGDSPDADPFYHWGALSGWLALLEAGLIEAPPAKDGYFIDAAVQT